MNTRLPGVLIVLTIGIALLAWQLGNGQRGAVVSAPPARPGAAPEGIGNLLLAEGNGGTALEGRRLAIESEGTAKADSGPREGGAEVTRAIRVLVKEDRKGAAPGVRVHVTGESFAGAGTTDEEGFCTVEIPADRERLDVVAEKRGYFHTRREWQGQEQLFLPLSPAMPFAGRVVDAETDAPIPGAEIELPHGECRGCPPDRFRADDRGEFLLLAVPVRQMLDFQFSADGYAPATFQFEMRDGEEGAPREFRLARGTRFHGEVVAHPDGAPIAGAKVSFYTHEVTTDAAGRFDTRVHPDPRDRWVGVKITATGFIDLEADLTPEQWRDERARRLPMPRGSEIACRLVDPEGVPVPKAYVTAVALQEEEGEVVAFGKLTTLPRPPDLPEEWCLDTPSTSWAIEVDKEGWGRFRGIPPESGSWYFTAHATGYHTGTLVVPRAAAAGEALSEEIALEPRGVETVEIRGRVLRDGVAVSAGIEWRAGERQVYCRTNEEGEYEIRDLPPGKIVVSVSLEELFWNAELCDDTSVELHAEPGARLRQDFDLTYELARTAGRVVMENGSPPPPVEVDISCPGIEFGVSLEGREDGLFEIDLPRSDREYEFGVNLLDTQYVARRVKAGDTDVRIVVPDLGGLRFRIRDEEERRSLDRFFLGWRRSGEDRYLDADHRHWDLVDAEGWYEMWFPVGEIDLLARMEAWGYLPLETFGVRIGGSKTSLDLKAVRGAAAALVLDEGEEPFPKSHLLLLLPVDEGDDVTIDPSNRFPGLSLRLTGSRYPHRSWGMKLVLFREERTAHVRGLAPGIHRFKVFPDDLIVIPEQIEVTGEEMEPVRVRWQRR